MNQPDTVHLLETCCSGAAMAICALDDVLPAVEAPALRETLSQSRALHQALGIQAQDLLRQLHQQPAGAGGAKKTMSRLKTGLRLSFSPGDHSVADLITDGCNLGVKTLNRCRNRYSGASPQACRIAESLIAGEEQLTAAMRSYL